MLSPAFSHPRELDFCASSISSAEISPSLPPRPDSPRLPLGDAHAASRARISQLTVWSDAALDEREDDDIVPAFAKTDRPVDRAVPRDGPTRRKSFFCGSTSRYGYQNWRAMGRNPGAMERRTSFRRGKSFHRYARIEGSIERGLPEFDDLVEGLNATKVTETQIVRDL